MGKTSILQIPWPANGMHRGTAYSQQPPGTCYYAGNVRNRDAILGRNRGGSRPGIAKAFAANMGAHPCQFLQPVTWVSSGTQKQTLVGGNYGYLYYSNGAATENVVLLTPQTSSTVTIAAGVVTLAAGTWPVWAAGGKLTVAAITYTVATLDSPTQLTLTDPTVNKPALTTYSLSFNFKTITTPLFATELIQKCYIADPSAVAAEGPVKIFDPSTSAVTLLTATKGTVPVGCKLICNYRARLCLAKDQNIYMSRQSAPTDWDFGADVDDTGRAFAFAPGEAGELAEPVTAMIPASDDLLIIGCTNSIWVCRGDPAYDGRVENISFETGILSGKAWGYTPEGFLVFCGRQGLYIMAPGAQSKPEPYSISRLPQTLIDLDPTNFMVNMQFSPTERGMHIAAVPTGTGSPLVYFLDWETKGLFQDDFLMVSPSPTAMCAYAKTASAARKVIFGGMLGDHFHFSTSVQVDDLVATINRVVIGPILLGSGEMYDGILQELSVTLAATSGDVIVKVYVGETAEAALAAYGAGTPIIWQGTMVAGVNKTGWVRARGNAVVLELTNGATTHWAVEGITAVVERFRGR